MNLPYNHIDPPYAQHPLPVGPTSTLSSGAINRLSLKRLDATIPTGRDTALHITLLTDSTHLAFFFAQNWGIHIPGEPAPSPDATIIALKGAPAVYGLPEALAHQRMYSEDERVLWCVGNEYYGNIKISVRGLCALLAPRSIVFLHGCSMQIDGRGLALMGTSGAGKTTLTAALRIASGACFQVVNDDWGPVLASEATGYFTREPHWHMKYPSVRALCPALELSPSMFPSENFHGSDSDPRARLLIPPARVFGEDGLASSATLSAVCVLARNPGVGPLARRLSAADMPIFEAAEYSAFYGREERFFDGSLFLYDDRHVDQHRQRVRLVLESIPVFLISNTGPPPTVAEVILDVLQKA